jgi:hypothetical protein
MSPRATSQEPGRERTDWPDEGFTATFIALASGIATWSLTEHAVRRLGGTIVAMAVGAFPGDWMLGHAHACAPIVPMIVTATVIAAARLALKPREPEMA